jgi:hypothetical protein
VKYLELTIRFWVEEGKNQHGVRAHALRGSQILDLEKLIVDIENMEEDLVRYINNM